jgi:hypothetical protein
MSERPHPASQLRCPGYPLPGRFASLWKRVESGSPSPEETLAPRGVGERVVATRPGEGR